MPTGFLLIIQSMLSWVFRAVVIKFTAAMAVFGAAAFMWPILIAVIGLCGCLSISAFDTALSHIPSGVWWFISLFNVAAGLKIIVCAFVTRFLIRRLPVIG